MGYIYGKNESSILRMIVSSEIQAQNEDFLAEFFSNIWNCQIMFLHNLRDLVKWQAWGQIDNPDKKLEYFDRYSTRSPRVIELKLSNLGCKTLGVRSIREQSPISFHYIRRGHT